MRLSASKWMSISKTIQQRISWCPPRGFLVLSVAVLVLVLETPESIQFNLLFRKLELRNVAPNIDYIPIFSSSTKSTISPNY